MRIAIGVESAYENLTGVGVYVRQLVRCLAGMDHRNDYTLFTSATYRDKPRMDMPVNERFRRRCVGLPHKVCQALWLSVNWPPVNRYIGEHDVYHCVTPMVFPAKGGRYIVTVHDLAAMLRPQLCHRQHHQASRMQHQRMLRRADHFVAVSEWTKRDMVEYLKLDPKRITVIPEGVRAGFKVVEPSEVEAVRTKYSLMAPYFLLVGDLNPRKNHVRVVRAFARLRVRTKEPISLVFAGPLGYRSGRTLHEVRVLGLSDRVKFLGYVPDPDVVALMNGASALVFTSLYEGFGLPILEAMACETPVITSNVSSMPEVAGDAALLVDPTSEVEIADAMRQVITDPKTCEDLVQRGRKRSRMFTWERAARQHLELYESMC